MTDQEIRNRVIEKLLRKKVVGGNKAQIDTVKNWLPSHDQGKAETLIRSMVSDVDCPIEQYGGGARDNVRLTNVGDAVEYLKDNNGNVPFGFD